MRWIGCVGAMGAAVCLLVIAVMGGPNHVSIIALILALVALGFALWQYTQGRFGR